MSQFFYPLFRKKMDKRPKQTAFNDWDPAHKTEYNITN